MTGNEPFCALTHLDYRHADTWLRWGDTFERLGNFDVAQRCYKEAQYIYTHPK